MKLQLTLLYFLAFIVLSCSTESTDTPDTPDDNDGVLIKKIIYNKGTSDEYTETYNYNGNKLISVDESDGYKTVYSYENDLLVKEENFFGGILGEYTTIEYNSEKKVIKLTEFWLEASGINGRTYEHRITYNDNNTFTDILYGKDLDTDFILWSTSLFSHEGKNITKIADDDGYELIFTYDDKNGIFKNIHQVEVLNLLSNNEFGSLIYSNTNNVTSFIEKDDGRIEHYSKENYIYTYNDNGYPKNAILKSESDGETEEDETIEYLYE